MNSAQRTYACCAVALLAACLIAVEGGAEGREGRRGLSDQGSWVIFAGGSAAKAGIKADDTILTVDGIRTPDGQSLIRVVRLIEPGKTVPVTVVREGRLLNVSVTMGDAQSKRGPTWTGHPSEEEVPQAESQTPSSPPAGKQRAPASKIPDDLGDLD